MTYFGGFIAGYLDYDSLKILHLFGIITFMGNIIITGWWKVMADRTGDYRIIAFAQRQVTVTDWLFTFGGVIIVIIAEFGMVSHMNENIMKEIMTERWLWWGFWLFAISGIIWGVILIPMQIAQARVVHEFAVTGITPERYWVYGKIWLWFGILAIVIPFANVYRMVVKS